MQKEHSVEELKGWTNSHFQKYGYYYNFQKTEAVSYNGQQENCRNCSVLSIYISKYTCVNEITIIIIYIIQVK